MLNISKASIRLIAKQRKSGLVGLWVRILKPTASGEVQRITHLLGETQNMVDAAAEARRIYRDMGEVQKFLPKGAPQTRSRTPEEIARQMRIYSKGEQQRLVDACERLREEQICFLGFKAGLRVSEMRRVSIRDLYPADAPDGIRVKGKGNKIRTVVLSDTDLTLFKKLFPKNMDLSVRTIQRAWDGLLKKASFQPNRIHDMRHTYATHFYREHGDLKALAGQLGHSSPGVTLWAYTHRTTTELKDMLNGSKP